MNETLLTDATVEPLTLPEVKEHLVVEHDNDDAQIVLMIAQARRFVEERTRTKLVRQKWRKFFDFTFPSELDLYPSPVQEVEQIQYLDSDGATQTLATSVYTVDIPRQSVYLAYSQTWPVTRSVRNAVWVDVWSGYYDTGNSPVNVTSDVPEDLRAAMFLLIDHMYEHRGIAIPSNLSRDPLFDALLAPHRVLNR